MSEQVKLGKVAMTLGGDYSSSQSYDKLTCVQYDGCSWVSKKQVPEGVAPTPANSAYWQKISDRGIQGPQGQSYVDKELVPIVNDLTTGGSANVLSAEQGKVLKGELAELSEETNNQIAELKTEIGVFVSTSHLSQSSDMYNYIRTPFKQGDKVVISNQSDGAMSRSMLIFDEQGNTNIPISLNTQDVEVTIPRNTSYIALYAYQGGVTKEGKVTLTVKSGFELRISALESARKIKGTDTDFLELDDQYNIFNKDEVVPDVYVRGSTGKEMSAAGFFASGFIPVKEGKTYYMASTLARYWAFYDADKNHLTGENDEGGFMTQITAPAGAAFFRFTMIDSTYLANAWMSAQPNEVKMMAYIPADNLVIPIELNSDELEDVKVVDYGNIIDRSKLTEGYYISPWTSSFGQPLASAGFACTDFCELEEGKEYHLYKIFDYYAGLYDSGKKCIKVYTTDDRLPNPFTPPEGAKYARFTIMQETSGFGRTSYEVCWAATNGNNTPNDFKTYSFPHNVQTAQEAGVNPCEYNGREVSVFRSILCIGDSLTFGAENYVGDIPLELDVMEKYGYPAHLAKMSGVSCLNKGDSGKTTQGWYDAHSGDTDLAGHDGAIIMLGINDWLQWAAGAPEAESFKASLGRIVDLVIEKNSSSTGTNKIKVYVATITQGISYMKNSAGDSVNLLNNAIREFCSAREDVILLDLARYGSTMKKMAYNRGHLSAIGYWRLAADFHGIISKHIADNLDLYVDLAFTGTEAVQYEYSATQW